nr:MAG TPA: hypothetical protein [Caudoviricetes sp.]
MFPDGTEAVIEHHSSLKRANGAVDAMNNHNRNDAAVGYGFPHGMPEYIVRAAQ